SRTRAQETVLPFCSLFGGFVRLCERDGVGYRPSSDCAARMIPEAELEQSGAGLVPASRGWFVMNASDARWFQRDGRGNSLPLTGSDEFEAETYFPMLGMSLVVLAPGEPNSMYHWETEQE